MIDLRNKGLPDYITIGGNPFYIKTDFREWLKFSEIIKRDFTLADLEYLFVSEVPLIDFFAELMQFYVNANATPKKGNSDDNTPVIDYILDGEYIVGSFVAVYGIDLTTCNMHWHLFKALFLSLPGNCKINEIIGMRMWKKTKRKEEEIRKELKEIWSLPENKAPEDDAIIQEINDLFYNC